MVSEGAALRQCDGAARPRRPCRRLGRRADRSHHPFGDRKRPLEPFRHDGLHHRWRRPHSRHTSICSRRARQAGRRRQRRCSPNSMTPFSPAMPSACRWQEFSTDEHRRRRDRRDRHAIGIEPAGVAGMADPATSSSPRRSPATASGPGPSAPISPNGRSARRSSAPGDRRPSASCSSPSPWSWRSFWESAFRGRSRRLPPRPISSPISSSSG